MKHTESTPRPFRVRPSWTSCLKSFSLCSVDLLLVLSQTVSTARTCSMALSISSMEMISGGANRITFSCVSLHSTPRSMSRSQYWRAPPASSTSCTPMSRPLPRTSCTSGDFMFVRSPLKYLPRERDLSTRSSFSSTRRDSRPTAAASGLPPNVEPWSPGRNTPMMSRLARAADTGSTPPPRALPTSSTSGLASSYWWAKRLPQRPNPVWISSNTNRMPLRVQISRTLAR